MRRSSANTFRTVSDLHRDTKAARQSIYNWIEQGWIEHQHTLGDGTPIFSQHEYQKAKEFALERRNATERFQLGASRKSGAK